MINTDDTDEAPEQNDEFSSNPPLSVSSALILFSWLTRSDEKPVTINSRLTRPDCPFVADPVQPV
jgi:hypothetical protein